MADEHRSRSRGERLRRSDDPEISNDPRVVAVLEQLNAVALEHAKIAPRPEFRAELRAQLVAITPRIVAEYAPATTEITGDRAAQRTAADRPRPSPRPRDQAPAARAPRRRSFWAALRTVPVGRPLSVAASLVVLLALVLGGAVYLSRDAVPGDTLYGLKRASERVELSFDNSDAERAADYLDFATTRVDEARTLVSRATASAAGQGPLADGSVSSRTAELIAQALNSADGNTQTATRLLGHDAVDAASPAPLTKLTAWAPGQLNRLAELRAAVPSGTPVNLAAAKSFALLQTANMRATTLQKRVDCKCLKDAPTDVYGPLPGSTTPRSTATPGSTKAPGAPATSAAPGGTRSTPSAPTGRSVAPTSPGGTPAKSSSPGRPLLPLPSLKLPSASPRSTSAPSLDLCKLNLLGIRICPSTSK